MLENNINMTTASDETLYALISEYGLNASVPFLREVGKCLSSEGLAPDGEILRFFDAIYTFATSKSQNINISDLYANDKEVVKTFSDMFEKHKYLCDTPADSISLDDMVHITSRYFSTLGISAPSSVCVTSEEKDLSFSNKDGKALLSLSLDNSDPLPYGYEKAKKKEAENIIADKGDLFVLISSDDDCSFKKLSKKAIKINDGGILPVITEHAFGAVVYANEDVASEISDLITRYKGQELLIVPKENESDLATVFTENGASAQIIAIVTDTPVFSIIAQNKVFNIRANFLRRMLGYKKEFVPKISSSSFEPTKYDHICCDDDLANQMVSKNGHLMSVLCTSMCSFTNGINILLDSIFNLLSKGIDRRNIAITFKIGYTAEHLSDAIATLLGVYRASIELCIPEKNSSIELSDRDYILCCAYTKNEGSIPQSFTDAKNSSVHLFSFGRFDDTTPSLMPDFASIRKMCDRVSSMIEENEVLSAMAVDGSVYTATKMMCSPDVSLSLVASDINEKTNAQGLVIQVKDHRKTNAPVIGTVQKEIL